MTGMFSPSEAHKLIKEGYIPVVSRTASNVMARRITRQDMEDMEYLESVLVYDRTYNTVRIRGNEERFKVGDWIVTHDGRFSTLMKDEVFRMLFVQYDVDGYVPVKDIALTGLDTLTDRQREILIAMDEMGSHAFYSPDFVASIEKAFGVEVMETAVANVPGDFRGLTVPGVVAGEVVSGAASHNVAVKIAEHYRIHIPIMMGRGFRFRATMQEIWKFFGEEPRR